jgi:hypothetical protein
MSSLVSKAQDVSCVTGISIQHVITDLFINVKSSLDLTFMNRSVITCYIEIPVSQDTSCVLETDVSCVAGTSIQHVITDLFMNVKSSL